MSFPFRKKLPIIFHMDSQCPCAPVMLCALTKMKTKKSKRMKNTKRRMDRINQIIGAWESLAPEVSFGGMTLEQFKAAVKPAFDSSDKVNALISEAVGEKKRWADNTQSSHEVAKHAVGGMLSGPNLQ